LEVFEPRADLFAFHRLHRNIANWGRLFSIEENTTKIEETICNSHVRLSNPQSLFALQLRGHLRCPDSGELVDFDSSNSSVGN
jgi:hypothetical protein